MPYGTMIFLQERSSARIRYNIGVGELLSEMAVTGITTGFPAPTGLSRGGRGMDRKRLRALKRITLDVDRAYLRIGTGPHGYMPTGLEVPQPLVETWSLAATIAAFASPGTKALL